MLNFLSASNEKNLPLSVSGNLTHALAAAGIGVWEFQFDDKQSVTWDKQCCVFFGLTDAFEISYNDMLSLIHSADRYKVDAAVKHAMDHRTDGNYDIKFRTVGAIDGVLRLIRFVGRAYFDKRGSCYNFSGIAMDVSVELNINPEQLKFKLLVENSPDFMGIANCTSQIQYLNPAAYHLLGIDPNTDIRKLSTTDFYAHHELFKREAIEKSLHESGFWSGMLVLKHFETGEIIPFSAQLKDMRDPYTDELIGRTAHLTDMRRELEAQRASLENEYKFRNVTDTSPTGLWLSDQEGNLTYINRTLTNWTGLPYETLLGTGWLNAIIDADKERSAAAFASAVNNRVHYDVEFRIKKANGDIVWCRAAGDPFYHENGTYGGYAGFCMDINERVNMLSDLRESEARVRSIVEQAPVAIGVLRSRDFVIESGNDAILKVWGRDKSIFGQPLVKALPEVVGQPFMQLLEDVYNTGKTFFGYETLAKIAHGDKLIDVYFDFVYAPLKNREGNINGILVVASEVTKQVLSKKLLQESEAQFRSLVEQSPVAIAVFRGKSLIIDIANDAMFNVWGKGTKVLGLPLIEALPELLGQPFIKILEDIFITKQPFHAQEAKANLVIHGKLETFYFNFTYQPLFDSNGEVYAIMDMAIDVTEQVINKNKIVEAEARLRIAIETADLGTWEIHPITKQFIASYRMRQWFGFDDKEEISLDAALNCIPEKEKFIDVIRKAKENYIGGIIDIEYTVSNRKTNFKHILHTVGQTFFDEKGEPYLMTGSTKNITLQRNTELELENLVQARTEELQALNEELELINNELAKTNENLSQSNHELAQYAYVASHDLQEPLRKIRVFSEILAKQPGLSAENVPLVNKINKASERMALLIKDLLEFSRLLKSEKILRPVKLTAVISDVINDFELVIAEKNAKIRVDPMLPTIDVVALQVNQLFYNLLGNALKFVEAGKAPEIEITSKVLTADEVKKYIHRYKSNIIYYDIMIKDNGIGFDVKYAEQIFEVFKRLQGRELYPGSGIGLALCRRIVNNHDGHLYAESEPGKGSVFHIILPAKQ